MTNEDPLDRTSVPRLGLSAAVLATIAVGGALGTVARYLLEATYPTASGHFPVTTLLINLSGSLAIGFFVPFSDKLTPRFSLARPFLVVGLLGGWTTYSTVAVEAVLLGQVGQAGLSAAYLAATVFGGVALVAVGAAAGHKVIPQ